MRERERLRAVVGGAPRDTEGPDQLRGNISESDADAIEAVLDALNPDVPGDDFRANGNGRETQESKTLANYVGRLRLAATAGVTAHMDWYQNRPR